MPDTQIQISRNNPHQKPYYANLKLNLYSSYPIPSRFFFISWSNFCPSFICEDNSAVNLFIFSSNSSSSSSSSITPTYLPGVKMKLCFSTSSNLADLQNPKTSAYFSLFSPLHA